MPSKMERVGEDVLDFFQKREVGVGGLPKFHYSRNYIPMEEDGQTQAG